MVLLLLAPESKGQPCSSTIAGPDTLRTCKNAPTDFDASASTPASGSTWQQLDWAFGDGSLGSGFVVQHGFSEAGAFRTRLTAVDGTGCSDTSEVLVLVASPADASVPSSTRILCLGDTGAMDAQIQQWSGVFVVLPVDTPVALAQIADHDTVTIATTVGQFGTGELLVDPAQIAGICISLEHSFMADLIISLACPNGQEVVLHSGGDGTNLGMNGPWSPGIYGCCWDYCWAETAPFGTWAASIPSGTTPHVGDGIAGQLDQNLLPGTYAPIEALSGLVGCPLNGTWTFTFIDDSGGDNGWLCNASLVFNAIELPDLSGPDFAQIEPSIGIGCDSASWTGPWILPPTDLCDPMRIAPSSPGQHEYQFHAADDHGCTLEMSTSVDVLDVEPTVSGEVVPLLGHTSMYRVSSPSPAYYNWFIQGGDITTGQHGPEVTVDWHAVTTAFIGVHSGINGCSGWDTLFVAPAIVTEGLSLGPMPVDGILVIRAIGSRPMDLVRVVDPAGRVMLEITNAAVVSEIETRSWPEGLYVLEVTREGSKVLRSFVVIHD